MGWYRKKKITSVLSCHLMLYSFLLLICTLAALIDVSTAMASEQPGQMLSYKPNYYVSFYTFCSARGGLKTG